MSTELTGGRQLLQLGGAGAWAVFAAYATAVLVLSLNGGRPSESPAGIVATVAALGAGALGVAKAAYPLPWWRTGAVVGLATLCNLLIVVQLTPNVWPGWAAWNLGITALAMIPLSLRGRIAAGWVGIGAMVAITVTWHTVAGGSPGMGIALVQMHVAVNFLVAIFALGIRSAARRIDLLGATERARVARLAAAESGSGERRAELRRIHAEAGETLARIAAGDVRAAERPELLVLEATLRDRIRARRLDTGRLRAAVREARQRGLEVSLLDDARGMIPESVLASSLEGAAERLAAMSEGNVTIRLAGEPLRMSLASSDGATFETWEIPSGDASAAEEAGVSHPPEGAEGAVDDLVVRE